jgi:hypothetical protein
MVDVNGNGMIDASDVPMGGIHKHTLDGPFKVIVEWKSTPEFAPVESISLFLGVWADEVFEGMVYTPHDGGPHVDPTTLPPRTARSTSRRRTSPTGST